MALQNLQEPIYLQPEHASPYFFGALSFAKVFDFSQYSFSEEKYSG
jgi:hypothetical protein